MELTKEAVNRCRCVGALRDFLCQAMDQINEKDKEIAQQKRKRCLALAKIASDNWHIYNSFYAMGKMDFEKKKCERYERHRLKWLALADEFKEAK